MNLIKVWLHDNDGTTERYTRDISTRRGTESFGVLIDVAMSKGLVCKKIGQDEDGIPCLEFEVEQ